MTKRLLLNSGSCVCAKGNANNVWQNRWEAGTSKGTCAEPSTLATRILARGNAFQAADELARHDGGCSESGILCQLMLWSNVVALSTRGDW